MGVRELIRQLDIGAGLFMTEPQVRDVLREAGISVAEAMVAHTVQEAINTTL